MVANSACSTEPDVKNMERKCINDKDTSFKLPIYQELKMSSCIKTFNEDIVSVQHFGMVTYKVSCKKKICL